MTTSKETPFKIEMHSRYNLRDWISTNFPFIRERPYRATPEDLQAVERRSNEIYEACVSVQQIMEASGSSYIEYYKRDWERIHEAHEHKDSAKMTIALEMLLGSIDWE